MLSPMGDESKTTRFSGGLLFYVILKMIVINYERQKYNMKRKIVSVK